MSALSPIVLELNPNEEDILDREIIRELTEGCGTLDGTAARMKRDEATIRRRMGSVLIRLLANVQKDGSA